METEKLELFAIVELFGHNRMAGKLTEQTVGSSSFARIDVPATSKSPSFTRIVNPSAIYAINPVTEEVMLAMAERISVSPIEAWDYREVEKRLLALKAQTGEEYPED